MIRALFKKQMMEVFSWIFYDRKAGKTRSKKGIIGYVILYLALFAFLGVIFFTFATMLCEPLAEAGFAWLYFALMGLLAVALGVFGGVFNTFASLYLAKDNDLLLSMPIPPAKILAARLSGVYAIGLLYELIVMIPALIVYFVHVRVGFLAVVFTLIIPLVLSVFVLTLSCILGWVVAIVSTRLKNKNIITVILSLAFLAGYYYIYSQAYAVIGKILANPDGIADSVRSIFYPFYHMGLAAGGNALSMLIFTAIIGALFGIVYLVLSKSFLRIATENRGTAKTKYKEKAVKTKSVSGALLHKEFRRFLSSPIYMLNCGLGIILMPVAAIALLIKGNDLLEMLSAMFEGLEDVIPLLAAAAICIIASMNDITAPSVSLEGKNLWIVQSLPVTARQALTAKLKLHLILTIVPAAILTLCVELVLKPSVALGILIPVAVLAFILMGACLGLLANLKMPNLKWTNETVPVKQSMAVTIALFGGWSIVVALGGLYFLCRNFLSPTLYLLIVSVLLWVVALVLLRRIMTKGAAVFESL